MKPPNVLLVLTDDQGWGDLSYLGNGNLRTPRIDRLAMEGARMQWFYVQPLCAPTRAELLTGRCFPRTGVKGVCLGAERLNLDETTIGDLFRSAGYATGCFGKWHSGQQYPYHPLGRGFDEFVGFCCGHWSHYFDSTIERNGIEFQSRGYLPDVLTDHALDFLERNRNRPFFCYVPLNTPHSPFQVPDAFYDRFRDRPLRQQATFPEREDPAVTRAALAMCENIDWNVGRLLDRLDQLELREDTIVVYLSDNGPNSWRWNGGMAGMKGTSEEGGVRSPCSITWSGRIAAGAVVDRIAGAIDLLPTLTDLCGVEIRGATKPLDGRSLRPLLLDGARDDSWPDRKLFAQEMGPGSPVSVRTQEFRAGGRYGGLYRMREDIGQERDLSGELPEEHGALLAAIEAWRAEMPEEPVETALPVGYAEFPHVYLPTQDAELAGGLERSSIHPNCSFITNWEDAGGTLTWQLDVRQEGDYDLAAMIACRRQDVGAVLEADCEGSRACARIDEAFDPPLRDRDDRVPRVESYDKAFRPLAMGVLRLPRGRVALTVRCREKPGPHVCELRALKLHIRT